MKLKCKSFAWGGIYILRSRSVLCMFWRYPRWCKQPKRSCSSWISPFTRLKLMHANKAVHTDHSCTNLRRWRKSFVVSVVQRVCIYKFSQATSGWTFNCAVLLSKLEMAQRNFVARIVIRACKEQASIPGKDVGSGRRISFENALGTPLCGVQFFFPIAITIPPSVEPFVVHSNSACFCTVVDQLCHRPIVKAPFISTPLVNEHGVDGVVDVLQVKLPEEFCYLPSISIDRKRAPSRKNVLACLTSFQPRNNVVIRQHLFCKDPSNVSHEHIIINVPPKVWIFDVFSE